MASDGEIPSLDDFFFGPGEDDYLSLDDTVRSYDGLVKFVAAARVDFSQDPESWQNWIVADFLEAIAASMDSHKRRGDVFDYPTRWSAIASTIDTGKIWE